MRTCVFYKMFWNCWGYNIEFGINLTRWLIGFGWIYGDCVHFNIGPMTMCFIKSVD